jgi:hypothetical protein
VDPPLRRSDSEADRDVRVGHAGRSDEVTLSRRSTKPYRAASRSAPRSERGKADAELLDAEQADAQWLQELRHYGLLRGCFRPREAVVSSARTKEAVQ